MQPFFSAPPDGGMRIVITTCPEDQVENLIRPVLEARLAGCIQAIPGVLSTYRWQGTIQHDREQLLLFKTALDRVNALIERLTELHPYDVPELAVLSVESVTTAYGKWLHDETRPETRP